MRKLLMAPVLAASVLLSGCYLNVTTPTPNLTVRLDAESAHKSGTATCTQVLYSFAFGDCSVNTAMRSGNMTKVHHVDAQASMLFWGLYSTLVITAYGE